MIQFRILKALELEVLPQLFLRYDLFRYMIYMPLKNLSQNKVFEFYLLKLFYRRV